jgi:hypothetical protein
MVAASSGSRAHACNVHRVPPPVRIGHRRGRQVGHRCSRPAAFILVLHLFGQTRVPVFVIIIATIGVASAAIFIVLSQRPEPIRFALIAATLVLYGVALFVLLCEAMLGGFAKSLTAKWGEKWTKGMDYVYLTFGVAGILASINRIEFLTGRFERADILAPLALATAVVIRLVKTRAEIGEWNKPKKDSNGS